MSGIGTIEANLYLVATRLGPLRERVVFVGGAVRGRLVTDRAVEGARPTDDIDVIVETTSTLKYNELEAELRNLGFKNDTREDAPVCRFRHGALTIDVMPIEPEPLGFSNPWYPHAMRTASVQSVTTEALPTLEIRVISATCFLATKLVS